MTSLLGDCTDPTSTSPSTTQPISNAMAIDALLSSISQIHHGSPGNVMGRSMMNNSVSTGLGTSTPGLLGPANMSDIGMCSLGSEESTLSESISILPPEEIASATSPSCVWSEDDSVARRAAPMAGVAWIIRDVPGVLSVSASPDRNAVLTAADAPFAMFLGTMTLRPEHRSDSEDDRDSDACDGPLSPRGDQTVTSWLYCAPLTCSSSVGLNPTSAPVPCVAWPSLALELQGVNRVLYVVPMTNEFRHAAFIDINGRCSRSYDSKSVRKIAQHISTALACLHEHGVFHGAIRPETVAVAVGARSAKMIFLPNMEQAVKEAGTDYFFTSPERRRCKSGPTAASDGWALGVTLYALLFGKVPFLTGRYEELLKLDFPSEGTSGKLRKWRPLLTALLLPDPEERLTPSDVSAGALNRLM